MDGEGGLLRLLLAYADAMIVERLSAVIRNVCNPLLCNGAVLSRARRAAMRFKRSVQQRNFCKFHCGNCSKNSILISD